MIDVPALKEKYNLKLITQKKEDLENAMSHGHLTGANMSALAVDLHHYSTLHPLMTTIHKQLDIYQQAVEMLKSETDTEMIEMAKSDLASSEVQITALDKEIVDIEIERQFGDPDDNKSAILEIRAGTGGEEAALFGADLFRMYSMFGKNKGWEVEVIDSSISENGGFKEVVAHIKGKNVFKFLKFESGVHRVQRIPATENAGRIHTSTASVAILPEAKEVDVVIRSEDLNIEVMRSSGAGGQSVNRTDSAVRITHTPSGIVVSCQETKYQDQNKAKAMELLRSRLYEKNKMEADKERSDMRSSQIGTAMRSEKIKTYNFPQNRITDHRIKKSWFNLEEVLNGYLEDILVTTRDMILKGQVDIGGDNED